MRREGHRSYNNLQIERTITQDRTPALRKAALSVSHRYDGKNEKMRTSARIIWYCLLLLYIYGGGVAHRTAGATATATAAAAAAGSTCHRRGRPSGGPPGRPRLESGLRPSGARLAALETCRAPSARQINCRRHRRRRRRRCRFFFILSHMSRSAKPREDGQLQ